MTKQQQKRLAVLRTGNYTSSASDVDLLLHELDRIGTQLADSHDREERIISGGPCECEECAPYREGEATT